MNTEHIDAVWIDERGEISLSALVALSGLGETEVRTLVEYGALKPRDPGGAEWSFERRCVSAVKVVGRLRRDLELDAPNLALALALVERIHELETELRSLRVMMPHRSS